MRSLAFVVLLTAFATTAPAQQAAKSAAGGRTANLPDFTALMKQQGPAVVNVITKREATKTARSQQGSPGEGKGQAPEDPLLEFFRRFMPDAPERGPGPGQGLGSGFIISHDG